MREVDGTIPMFGFIAENVVGDDWYVMAVMHPRYLKEGDVGSHCTLLGMGNGGAQNRVIFNQTVYPNQQSAFPSLTGGKGVDGHGTVHTTQGPDNEPEVLLATSPFIWRLRSAKPRDQKRPTAFSPWTQLTTTSDIRPVHLSGRCRDGQRCEHLHEQLG